MQQPAVKKAKITDNEIVKFVLSHTLKDKVSADKIEQEYSEALNEANEKGYLVEQVLFEKALLNQKGLDYIAKQLDYKIADDRILKSKIELSVFKKMPLAVYSEYCFYPISVSKDILKVVTPYQRNRKIRAIINSKMGLKDIKFYYAPPAHINATIEKYFNDNSHHLNVRSNIEVHLGNDSAEIFNNMLMKALEHEATDIHILSTIRGTIVIKLRVLGEMLRLSEIYQPTLASQFSRYAMQQSGLKPDEHNKKQDSAFTYEYKIDNIPGKMNLRSSYAPSNAKDGIEEVISGKVIALRVLAESKNIKPLSDLGYKKEDVDMLMDVAMSGRGLVLFTGSTGSGKTSSVYSILEMLDNGRKNILSVENPAEIKVDFVSQLKTENDDDMLETLTAILRLDPDIVFTGEARSKPSAEVAVECANTSHLTFSTMHTKDAKGVFTRLKRFGIELDELTEVLKVVIYQKLVRRLCPKCKKEVSDPVIIDKLSKYYPDNTFYTTGNGCSSQGCFAGYISRRPMYEILTINPEVKKTVLSGEIYKLDKLVHTRMEDTVSHEISEIEVRDLTFLYEDEKVRREDLQGGEAVV